MVPSFLISTKIILLILLPCQQIGGCGIINTSYHLIKLI